MKSLEELRALRAAAQAKLGIRNDDAATIKVVVGMGTCGIAAGARAIVTAFTDEVAKSGLQNVSITISAKVAQCENNPVAEVTVGDTEKVTYVKLTAEKVQRIVSEHLVNGNVVTEYTSK